MDTAFAILVLLFAAGTVFDTLHDHVARALTDLTLGLLLAMGLLI